MRVSCVATIDNKEQRQNLCECITLLGGVPEINGTDVSVDFADNKEKCEIMISIFEQYPRHGIYEEP